MEEVRSEVVPVRGDRTASVVVRGDVVVVDEHERIHVLEGSAAAIWQMLDGRANCRAIAEELAERFQQAPAQVEKDVQRFVESCMELGLVAVEDV